MRNCKTWGIQTGPFAACWANFDLRFFHFFALSYWRPIIITPENGSLNIRKGSSHNLSVREGFLCPGHSNWTICSLANFDLQFYPFHTGVQLLLSQRVDHWKWENGILTTSVLEREFCAWGIQTGPFATCWANFVWKIFLILHLHTVGQFLLPQRVEGWKWEIGILTTWVWEWDFSAWGIQIGPYAACLANFVL